MGITRTSRDKRSHTGAQRAHYRKKRKFEMGRQPAMTKLGAKRVHVVRTRGGNEKHRALRLESGNYAWGSEQTTRKTRIIGVVYNATNNELVRTNTLVKNSIVQIDAAPFRQWYEAHYGQPVVKKGRSKEALAAVADEADKKSNHVKRTLAERQKEAKIDPLLESQFAAGRLYAAISSRPGQSGRADGYILEGKELEFYVRRLRAGKKAHAHEINESTPTVVEDFLRRFASSAEPCFLAAPLPEDGGHVSRIIQQGKKLTLLQTVTIALRVKKLVEEGEFELSGCVKGLFGGGLEEVDSGVYMLRLDEVDEKREEGEWAGWEGEKKQEVSCEPTYWPSTSYSPSSSPSNTAPLPPFSEVPSSPPAPAPAPYWPVPSTSAAPG
ncbi:hypothetical protein JCM8547_006847 [Rhodosporidiobolus lusitaniae]